MTPNPEKFSDQQSDNVMYVDYAPFDLLLPRVSALVHHGGIGTIVQALVRRVPQLIVPHRGDQFDNAFRLEKLGCGLSLSSKYYKTNQVKEKIEKLINSTTIREQCNYFASKIDFALAEEQTCQLIEEFVKT